jgi:pyruvate/2-oxoglutarate dehydrogenase complex dihydrolipoamide acyltransferase (E2) component
MVDVCLPDFDLPGVPLAVSNWHSAVGQHVVEGDRLVEVSAGDAVVDVAAPATGLLVEKCVRIEDPLTIGQVLARIQPRPPQPPLGA